LIDELPEDWYRRFEFKIGVASKEQLPVDTYREVAFAGRSNVGKSSVINKIVSRRNLARTSKSPGRTRELNYFSYDEKTFIVDLPGYGYAKVDNPTKHAWTKLLNHYLEERSSLCGIFLIIDIRHPLKKFDQMMLEYCGANNLALHIILNKSDKLSINNANKVMAEIKEEIREINASIQMFSALKGIGVEIARHKLAEWLFD
jgi:GTP-binding protein